MRISVFSRSVIAVAALAVGSAALTAAPANAAPATVTRAEVLAVTGAVRAESPTSSPGNFSSGTLQAIQNLAGQACSVEQHPGDYVYGVDAVATQAGQGADGLAVRANIYTNNPTYAFVHYCDFAVVASTATSSALSGTLLFGPTSTALAGEVTVTPAVFTTEPGLSPALRASGQSVQTLKVVTSKKVSTPKSSKQKKSAKKTYAKRLKAAKKSYAKALRKAGGSKTKKAAAKRAYVSKKAKAKRSYKKARASHKIVKRTRTKTSIAPFTLSAR